MYSRPNTLYPRNETADTAPPANQTGRVRFDVRGNAVWEWKTETGDYSREINTQRLKKLQAPELQLEQAAALQLEKTDKNKKLEMFSLLDDVEPGASFNPYNQTTKKTPDAYQARVAIPSPQAEAPKPEKRPIKDLRAYGEWLAMKRRLAEKKDDDDTLIG
jgi:hypothetical protein